MQVAYVCDQCSVQRSAMDSLHANCLLPFFVNFAMLGMLSSLLVKLAANAHNPERTGRFNAFSKSQPVSTDWQ